jgi:amidase
MSARHHLVTREHVIYEFDARRPPAATIDPGDQVTFETLDSWSGTLHAEDDILRPPARTPIANPATGPVYVRDASPGDALAVRVDDVALETPGYAKSVRSGGILRGEVPSPRLYLVEVVSTADGYALQFPDRLGGMRLAARPMIGVIGTAPTTGSISTLHPGDHGGNIDILALGPGATVYLPVRVAGGLLALGDCHAIMGDGELSGAGVDVSTRTTVAVELVRGMALDRPMIETSRSWITYGHTATRRRSRTRCGPPCAA